MDDSHDSAEIAFIEAGAILSLLRAAIYDPAVLRDIVAAGLSPDDALAPGVRTLIGATLTCQKTNGRVDPLLVRELLDGTQDADAIMSALLDAQPLEVGDDPTSVLMVAKRRVALRRLTDLGAWLSRSAKRIDGDHASIVSSVRGALDRIQASAAARVGTTAKAMAARVLRVISGEETARGTVPAGHPGLDRALGGGLPRGSMSVQVAGTGVGKSSYARHTVISIARSLGADEQIAYVSFEDRKGIDLGLAGVLGGVRISGALYGEEASRASEGAALLDSLPIVVLDGRRVDADGLIALVRAESRHKKIAAVVLDYGQDLATSSEGPDGHAKNSDAIRTAADEDDCAWLVYSQRATETTPFNRGPPKADLPTPGSTRWGRDAAVGLETARNVRATGDTERHISKTSILKNRPTGEIGDFFMRYDPRTTRLHPCDSSGRDLDPGAI